MIRALLGAMALPLCLAGCLEVEQNTTWNNGQYAGKKDNRASDKVFGGDTAAWAAAVRKRNLSQNEYERAKP